MSKTKNLTTLQVEKQTRDMLREIAQFYERSMVAQIRSMIKAEYARLHQQNPKSQNSRNKPTIKPAGGQSEPINSL